MPATFNVSCVTERGPGCTVRNAGGTTGCIHLDNLGGQRRKQSGFGIESSLGSQREAVAARDVERGEATFGREKVESSGTWVRSNLGWSEMASQLLRGGIAVKGIRNKERGEERERGKGENKGEEWVRVVFVEEQREGTWTKIGPVMEMRGPGGQWVSGPGPLNS